MGVGFEKGDPKWDVKHPQAPRFQVLLRRGPGSPDLWRKHSRDEEGKGREGERAGGREEREKGRREEEGRRRSRKEEGGGRRRRRRTRHPK